MEADPRKAIREMVAALKDESNPFDPPRVKRAIRRLWTVNRVACWAAERAANEYYPTKGAALENLELFERYALLYVAVEEVRRLTSGIDATPSLRYCR